MRCVDCEHFRFFINGYWCEATKKSKRVLENDALKDAPCKRGKLKGEEDGKRSK